ncbi:hypothetical protein EJ03DRAFT_84482 [Teratosphaeria nubilosa]|uniref:Uncharacterized protein n=1 Tax=Teratosphaeria nubilosa TaxID=161662 RepID=A0A6G1LC90_9PEZI|nr:hypothetical protein EJ03DRAFT_84482 [Teratosphaeria nubilosa]
MKLPIRWPRTACTAQCSRQVWVPLRPPRRSRTGHRWMILLGQTGQCDTSIAMFWSSAADRVRPSPLQIYSAYEQAFLCNTEVLNAHSCFASSAHNAKFRYGLDKSCPNVKKSLQSWCQTFDRKCFFLLGVLSLISRWLPAFLFSELLAIETRLTRR